MIKPLDAFDPLVRTWLVRGLVLTLLAVALLIVAIIAIGPNDPAHWKLALDALKLIVVGFFVAYLGILIPKGFSEARHTFQKLKEARIAFSRAKTGVDYLSLRLGVLSLREASVLIQQTHVWKHRAELYPDELVQFLAHRDEKWAPREWAELLYCQLHAVRDALELHAASWDKMAVDSRIGELRRAQETGIRSWEQATGLKYPWPVAQQDAPGDAP